jgi:hypothetical protein
MVGYYTQLASGQLQVDTARVQVTGPLGNAALSTTKTGHLSPAFDLIPSNNPLPAFGPHFTTNYDRTIRPCYDIGEYMASARTADDSGAAFAWGDNRNSWTSPPASPAAGTHSQPDVFATSTP